MNNVIDKHYFVELQSITYNTVLTSYEKIIEIKDLLKKSKYWLSYEQYKDLQIDAKKCIFKIENYILSR